MTTEAILNSYNEGRIDEAIKGLQSEVKGDPANEDRRWLLFQLYCISAMYEKADKQIDYLIHTSASNPIVYSSYQLYRNVLRGELKRREFFSGKLDTPSITNEDKELLAESIVQCQRIALGETAAGRSVDSRVVRYAKVKTSNGIIEGDFTDGDDITAAALEVIYADGRYGWLSWNSIDSIVFDNFEQPIDLLFRQAEINLKTDEEDQALKHYVPTTYPWTEDDVISHRQAKETDWVSDKNSDLMLGKGQKCFLVGDDLVPVLEIEEIRFIDRAMQ